MKTDDLLNISGLKCTRQRKEVIEILKNATMPLRAEDIFEKTENMALSTIYRIIEKLIEKGIAVKTTIPKSDGIYYELMENEHKDYAICIECHKMKYIDICPLHHTKLDDFTVTGHRVELYGYCNECRK